MSLETLQEQCFEASHENFNFTACGRDPLVFQSYFAKSSALCAVLNDVFKEICIRDSMYSMDSVDNWVDGSTHSNDGNSPEIGGL